MISVKASECEEVRYTLVFVECSSAGGEQRGNNGTGELHFVICIFLYFEECRVKKLQAEMIVEWNFKDTEWQSPVFYSPERPVLSLQHSHAP